MIVLAAGQGTRMKSKLAKVLQDLMDLSPRGIRTHLGLNKPIYGPSAAYGHFGRDDIESLMQERVRAVRLPVASGVPALLRCAVDQQHRR